MVDVARIRRPWYKEIWFWLLVSPMLTLIVTVPIMLTTAFKGADDRVLDDYYKEGRMINHRFEEHRLARTLGLRGEINYDPETEILTVHFLAPINADTIQAEFSHPADENQDFKLALNMSGPQRYKAPLSGVEGRWYLILQGDHQDARWRINTEVTIKSSGKPTHTTFNSEHL